MAIAEKTWWTCVFGDAEILETINTYFGKMKNFDRSKLFIFDMEKYYRDLFVNISLDHEHNSVHCTNIRKTLGIRNFHSAFDYMTEWNGIMTVDLVLKLHSLVIAEISADAGKYGNTMRNKHAHNINTRVHFSLKINSKHCWNHWKILNVTLKLFFNALNLLLDFYSFIHFQMVTAASHDFSLDFYWKTNSAFQ